MSIVADPLVFTGLDLRRRLGERPDADQDDWGDHRFNPGHPRLHRLDALRSAAVLIPVVDRGPEEALVILTKRAETLRDHTGQVAFPGGRIDADDASPEAAALREANEEIGLAPDRVEVIGRLPDYVSGSGYRISPVLGLVRPGYDLTPNREEVDAVFDVPLGFLMQPGNHKRASRVWNEREWVFYEMPFGGHRIWGVTAGIIRSLYERLYP